MSNTKRPTKFVPNGTKLRTATTRATVTLRSVRAYTLRVENTVKTDNQRNTTMHYGFNSPAAISVGKSCNILKTMCA